MAIRSTEAFRNPEPGQTIGLCPRSPLSGRRNYRLKLLAFHLGCLGGLASIGKETSYLTTPLHKPMVVVEVVTTFSSFRSPELSQSI